MILGPDLGLLAGGFLGGLLAWEMLVRCPSHVEVVRHRLALPGLPGELKGRRLVFVSDVHFRRRPGFRELWLSGIVPRLKPDLLCLGGDLVECTQGAHYLLEMVEGWSAPLGIYYVYGNNELRHQSLRGFGAQLEARGVRVLRNSHLLVGGSDSRWAVAGVDDPAYGTPDLEKTLKGIPSGTFTILLSHSPVVFPQAREAGIPLTLSGHTHGGQVRFPVVGALWTDTPETGLRYQMGLYQEGPSTLVVSKGIGVSKLPIRLLARPDILCLDLEPA